MIIKPIINHFLTPLYPIEAVLYITDACNLKCSFCEIGLMNMKGKHGKISELSFEQVEKIVAALRAMNTKNIYITGGEPFLSKSFWHLLEFCIENSITVSAITTNGTMLNRLSEAQVALLNRVHVKRIIISIDSHDAQEHDELRGRTGLFDEVESFLRSDKSKKIKTLYCISTVVNSQNYMHMDKLVDWSASVGNISHVNFQPVCDDSIFVDHKSEPSEKSEFLIASDSIPDLMGSLEVADKKAKDLKLSTSLPFLKIWIADYFRYAKTDTFFFNKVMRGYVCSKPYNFIHINYNGDMLACTHIGPIANIGDGDILPIWRKAALKYKRILKKGKYFNQCHMCFCDFGANYRYSLIYRPLSNISHIVKTAGYYLNRYIKGTK